MIITRTPYRISFFGGGSDYEAWYSRHGGAVLSTTIDKYCYISLRRMPPFLGSKYRVFWSQMEAVDEREDIQHAGVRGCLEFLDIDDGIEINHAGDLPARSGLGSSSALIKKSGLRLFNTLQTVASSSWTGITATTQRIAPKMRLRSS